jgi:hypothetical protein
MALPERDYYPLPLAASLIGCSPDDLIHWAANGRTRLGVLFHIDEFEADRYHWMESENECRGIDEFHGFVYVDRGYFSHLEMSGEFAFNAVKMLDGSDVFLTQGAIERRSIEGIFMHRGDLLPMLAQPTKPLTTTERNTLLTIIAALCNYSAIKPDDRGAASQIAKLTEEIGATVSDDTVRRWLKQIPDALESRMK